MEARGALGRPFWDSSPLMTPIFITWTIPGHFFLVRAVPGAVPTAAASMDGSDGRPDGSPGGGKGLKQVDERTCEASNNTALSGEPSSQQVAQA